MVVSKQNSSDFGDQQSVVETMLSAPHYYAAFEIDAVVDLETSFYCLSLDEDIRNLATEVWKTYISEAEYKARESWKRIYRKLALSTKVSKGGHLCFLVPKYEQVSLESTAKDEVVHLETMILAEEQEAPTATAVGQILISGRGLWMRWKKKLLHSLSSSLQNRSSDGFRIALASAAVSFC